MNNLKYFLLLLPSLSFSYDASVYSAHLKGSRQATSRFGRYDPKALTCATGTQFPIGTHLKISWKGKSVIVTVTDRIARRFYKKRIDLSGAAFKALYSKYNYTDRTGTILKNIKVETIKK